MNESYYSLTLAPVKEPGQSTGLYRVRPDLTIQPRRLLSTVVLPELVTMTGFSIDGQEQLVMPMDAYQFSAAAAAKLDAEFLRENGLTALSEDELQEWLDDRDMEMPGSGLGRFTLPLIRKGAELVLRVEFGSGASDGLHPFVLIGMGLSR